MSALLLTCPHCGWERVSMSARADMKAREAHAKTHEKESK